VNIIYSIIYKMDTLLVIAFLVLLFIGVLAFTSRGDRTGIIGGNPATWSPTRIIGGDPSTWSPTRHNIGGDPSTWSPTKHNIGGDPSTWSPTRR